MTLNRNIMLKTFAIILTATPAASWADVESWSEIVKAANIKIE